MLVPSTPPRLIYSLLPSKTKHPQLHISISTSTSTSTIPPAYLESLQNPRRYSHHYYYRDKLTTMDDSTFDPDPDANTTVSDPLLNITNDSPSTLSPLEQEVLDEYARLLGNMNTLQSTLSSLASGPITIQIADELRLLERKVTSVYTLMKASVYSIVLQQGSMEDE